MLINECFKGESVLRHALRFYLPGSASSRLWSAETSSQKNGQIYLMI